jgi:hypothetical protein
VDLALEGGAQTVTSLIPGYRAPRPGDEVRLSVEGAVMAYPRADSDAARVEPSPPRDTQFPTKPLSVAALGIKEDLP